MMITPNPLVYAPGAILKVRQTIQMMITSNAFVCTRSTVQAVKFARSVLSGQLVFPGEKCCQIWHILGCQIVRYGIY